MFHIPRRHRKSQGGFSLVEVLVAGAILSSGLASIAALLITSVAGTAQTAHRSTAMMLAESMRANLAFSPQSINEFLIPPPSLAPICDEFSACSASQFAQSNFQAWDVQVKRALPGGLGIVCRDESPFDGVPGNTACSGGGPVVVKIFWRAGESEEPADGKLVRIVFR